ncbi:unnamed protein product [Sphagnum balticum]
MNLLIVSPALITPSLSMEFVWAAPQDVTLAQGYLAVLSAPLATGLTLLQCVRPVQLAAVYALFQPNTLAQPASVVTIFQVHPAFPVFLPA